MWYFLTTVCIDTYELYIELYIVLCYSVGYGIGERDGIVII